MSGMALLFMAVSWTAVLGLAGWCIHRILLSRPPDKADEERAS